MTPNIIGWTTEPVIVANTNRDGSGTLYDIFEVLEHEQYIDSFDCRPLGTNVATEGVIIGSNGHGIVTVSNNFLVGSQALEATTLGSPLSSDYVTFQVGAWFPEGFVFYALVHDAQASGRQFKAYSHPSYQQH